MSVEAEIVIQNPVYNFPFSLDGVSAITSDTAFTPTTPADWTAPAPDNAQAAIDGLADRVRALEVALASLPS